MGWIYEQWLGVRETLTFLAQTAGGRRAQRPEQSHHLLTLKLGGSALPPSYLSSGLEHPHSLRVYGLT